VVEKVVIGVIGVLVASPSVEKSTASRVFQSGIGAAP
jgi:hypothetical protein